MVVICISVYFYEIRWKDSGCNHKMFTAAKTRAKQKNENVDGRRQNIFFEDWLIRSVECTK